MRLQICFFGQDILRKKCREVKNKEGIDSKLISDMFETLKGSCGSGLAAPQVGKDLRLFVVDATDMGDMYPECRDFKKVFINPKIVKKSKVECGYTERCLSLPGLDRNISRPEKITLEYYDEEFVQHKEKFDGMCARIIQHECDHLDGKMIIDY